CALGLLSFSVKPKIWHHGAGRSAPRHTDVFDALVPRPSWLVAAHWSSSVIWQRLSWLQKESGALPLEKPLIIRVFARSCPCLFAMRRNQERGVQASLCRTTCLERH